MAIFMFVGYKGGVIKYETDRGGRYFEISLKRFVAQHKEQKEFPCSDVSSKKSFMYCFCTMNCKIKNLVHWYRNKEYTTSKGFNGS